MFVALQIASALATLSEPFLPFTSTKLKKILCTATLIEQLGMIFQLKNFITSRSYNWKR